MPGGIGYGALYSAGSIAPAASSTLSVVYVPVVHSLNWGLAHCAGNLLLIYICNLLLIYICKLHWNLNTMFECQVNSF